MQIDVVVTQDCPQVNVNVQNAGPEISPAIQDVCPQVVVGVQGQGPAGPEGPPGKDGAQGIPGADGFSPTVSTESTENGTRVTFTDKNGEHSFEVLNGKDGSKYEIGNGLSFDPNTNTLSVNTANAVQQDNTLPVTSAAVFATVGNIEALLGTI